MRGLGGLAGVPLDKVPAARARFLGRPVEPTRGREPHDAGSLSPGGEPAKIDEHQLT